MAYIGNTADQQAFTPAIDYFNGDGSTVAFTLSRIVASVAQVQAVIENVPQNPGDAFTVSGNTITFTSAPPSGTSNIYVYYTSPITQVIQPGQGTVGTTQLVDDAVTSDKLASGLATQWSTSGANISYTTGNVGIGTSSPNINTATGTVCHINNGTANAWAATHYTNGSTGSAASDGFLVGALGSGDAYVFNYENTPMLFATNSSERMRLLSSGELCINTAVGLGGSAKLNIVSAGGGSWGMTILNPTSATISMPALVSLNAAGGVVGYINSDNTSTAYITTSDYRLKENIAPITGALAKVAQLKPCTYTWKSDGSTGEGFVAHELAEVCPTAVSGEKDAVFEDGSIKPQGIDTSFLVATLSAAIQEQQAIIEDLKARIETLESK